MSVLKSERFEIEEFTFYGNVDAEKFKEKIMVTRISQLLASHPWWKHGKKNLKSRMTRKNIGRYSIIRKT